MRTNVSRICKDLEKGMLHSLLENGIQANPIRRRMLKMGFGKATKG